MCWLNWSTRAESISMALRSETLEALGQHARGRNWSGDVPPLVLILGVLALPPFGLAFFTAWLAAVALGAVSDCLGRIAL